MHHIYLLSQHLRVLLCWGWSRYYAWFLGVGSRFTLYRPSSVPFCHADTNLLYVYNMSNGNLEQLFLYSTLHNLYVCKHGNLYFNWGPRSARYSRTVYSKIQTHCFITFCFKNPSTYSVAARRYLHRYILSARMFVRFV